MKIHIHSSFSHNKKDIVAYDSVIHKKMYMAFYCIIIRYIYHHKLNYLRIHTYFFFLRIENIFYFQN
jgi:hypothetical protein